MKAAVVTAMLVGSFAAGTAGASAEVVQDPVNVAACGGTASAPPGFWGPEAKSSCGTAGYPGYRKGYSWQVVSGDVTVCVQAWGYDANGRGTWYPLGCGQSARGSVPWGNRLATGMIKARSVQLPFAAIVSFNG